MATIMTKRGQLDNVVTYEHICDTVADMANINPSYVTLGSVCIVIKGENDDLEVYMADSRKEWKIISSSSGESSGESSSGIHICAQDEYDSVTGMPTIEDPLSNTFYLTPGGNETNDLYNEWIWLEDDEEWEKFGSATTTISQSNWNQSDSSADDFIKNKPAIRQQANGGILENGATDASGQYSHAEGNLTTASGTPSHAEGGGTTASGVCSHAEGGATKASGDYSHAEGGSGTASGNCSHAEGTSTTASGTSSHAEGGGAIASESYSHAEGSSTTASGKNSHAEGGGTTASGNSSHAEGGGTTAYGGCSHAEGGGTTASGNSSHAEGGGTTASGENAHAEGSSTTASGNNSHAEGIGTIANHRAQHVFGSFNISDDSTQSSMESGNYAEIVGNGSNDNSRSNARTLDWNGNEEVAGDVVAYGCGGANPISLSGLKNQVDQSVSDVQVNGVSVVSNGVANVSVASSSALGVAKYDPGNGIAIYPSGSTYIYRSNTNEVKAGSNEAKPIVPFTQHLATFYGLAKAAGDTTQSQSSNAVGNYTDAAKAAIKDMLGITEGMNIVTVSGTAPTINAASNTQYLCGEVLSLNLTPSATGICDVIFTSGSTQTVLTVPATVKMPEWFEVEANKIYEISITNGVYGAVMVWENA